MSGGIDIGPELAERGASTGSSTTAVCVAGPCARAHARAGDAAMIAGYLGRSDTSTPRSAFAEAYADQNERDYEAFARAARDGRIEVA